MKEMKKLEKIIASQPWLHIRITWGAVKKKKKHPKPEPNNHFSPSKKSLRMWSCFEFNF